nr:uncharacterized protein LOC121116286 [Lepeophtheirus salmonis]
MKYILSIFVLGFYLFGVHATSDSQTKRITGDWLEDKRNRTDITDLFRSLNVPEELIRMSNSGSPSEQLIVNYGSGYFIQGRHPIGLYYNSTITQNKLGLTPFAFSKNQLGLILKWITMDH